MGMEKQKIVWLEVQSPAVMEEANRALPEGFVVVYPQSRTDREEHTRLIAEADYLITQGIVVDREQIFQAKKLKMIQKFGVGVDKIDLEAARERNIPVCITAGANAVAVAELAIALMLAVNRRLPYVDRAVRAGQWPKAEMRAQCYMLGDKTVGLIGIGNIAKEVARRLSGFGVKEILYYDIAPLSAEAEERLGVHFASLEKLMAAADIVSIHVPLCDGTRGMIGKEQLALMKPTSILINTSRGHIIDEAALVEALWNKRIRGAGIDAFDEEPVSPDNPLLVLENTVLTCHYGGSVIDNVLPRARHAYGNIEKFSKGEPLDPRDIVVPKR
ncbi:MAG: dehydrogenase [Oscillospiraceae bacterium]|nr:MAG: dehydrogenase [Oscillospiraceae bacterium]